MTATGTRWTAADTKRGDAETAGGTASRLRFDHYVLDLDRGSLLLDGAEIPLRPKTFAVLRYLAENRGRLVSKDELFAAVWPNVVVTDDALVQSIGELRRALGEDGPRIIRTVPRRGYRLEDVTPARGSEAPNPQASPSAETGAARRVPAALGVAERLRKRALRSPRTLLAVAALAITALAAIVVSQQVPLMPAPRVAVAARPVVAVLPLANQSDDAAREYFADGLTGDIINALGRFSGLTVMSWNAVAAYKGNAAGSEQITRALAANYMVEGNVRRDGDRMRVGIQLVDAAEGHVLWAARFEEALADIFALQDKISTEVVRALAIRLTQIEQRRALAKPTQSLEAYDYVLRARALMQRPTRGGNADARTLLRRAIELDPNYGSAHAMLAESYYVATSMGWAESPAEFLDRAEGSARDALSLDGQEVRARTILARINIFHQRYAEAKGEIDLAMAANPNDAQALAGRGNILMWLGQTDEAIDALEQAERIDPDLSAIDRFALSLAYYLKKNHARASAEAELNLRQNADARFSRVVLAAAYAKQGRAAEAARVAEMVRLDPTFDRNEFGTKFLNPVDLEELRSGLRAAGL